MRTEKESATPRCSIIIRAYNEEEHIGRLLAGIMQQTKKDVEIILVDSGSTDATVSIASQYPVKVVSIKPQEFTFGRSLNQGIQAANGEFMVIASAHVYPVYPDWLEKILEPFEDETIALSYGKQRGASTSKFSEHQYFKQWFPDTPAPHQNHPFCNNANAAIRKSLWEERPYDEGLTGLEDLDWANWVIEKGYGIAYVPEAEIIHVHREKPLQVYNRFRREAMAFKYIYPKAVFTFYDLIRLSITNIVNDLWHAVREKVLWKSIRSIFWFRTLQFWGTYRGYQHSGTITNQLREIFYYPPGMTPPPVERREIHPIDYGDS
ncbi:MAG: glycosyltransferase family 2 protein [Anaerolineales bacterium]|nr:glycosyltransferase family 2 protein [Anaerolineales bacterium]